MNLDEDNVQVYKEGTPYSLVCQCSCFVIRVTGATCFTCFILGLPMCFSGGVYLFTLLDWNTASWAILIIVILECTAVSWSYGITRAMRDLAFMNMKLNPVLRFYWKAVWTFIVPIGSLDILVFVFIEWTPPSYGDYKFSLFADLLGWAVGFSTLIFFPVGVCWILWKGHRGKDLFRPTKIWKPAVRIEDQLPKPRHNSRRSEYDNIGFIM